jgi:TrpR-related protein YerC/YecD
MQELFEAILTLRNKREAANFFRDLLTVAELKEFANRWQMVKLLHKGTPYITIAKKLNVSTATVTRVAFWLKKGFRGYKTIATRVFPTSPRS